MKQDISQKKKGVDFGSYDSIVIKKHITDIEGGRTLDVEGYPEDVLLAAHVIISKADAEGVKTYMPMPVKAKTKKEDGKTVDVLDEDGGKVYEYDTLPEGAVYEGVLYRSILKEKPAASILIDGVVNDKVMKIELGSIASAFKAACPHIIFNHDEEA
ncbi:MAG: hypothetical protein IJ729_03635 [Alloprevotella sp.]|nr:hypothetical protein [Alloprevotella sp.]